MSSLAFTGNVPTEQLVVSLFSNAGKPGYFLLTPTTPSETTSVQRM